MGAHPLNLFLRFLLELMALTATGIWGWHQSDSWLRFVFASLIPITLAVIWSVFAVPKDPSRSGRAPVPVSGILRLVIELGFFGFAIWALRTIGWTNHSIGMGILVIFHYIISYDRIKWLLDR